MFATVAAILPLFALIAAGFGGRRLGVFGATSQAELTRFVVRLALPVLMFGILAEARPGEIWQPGFILVFTLGCIATFALAVALRWRRVGMADAIVDGLTAAYPNTAFLGIPLCLTLFGTAGLLAPSIASIVTVCLLFASTILLIEMALTPGTSAVPLIGKAVVAALKNPLVFAPALGAVMCFGGFSLPAPVMRFVDLLGAAAPPCALVSLGMFIGERRPDVPSGAITLLTLLKLIVQPAITFVLAYLLWPQPPFWAKLAVLIAALPTGTGPFMLAELYSREADVAARTILVSTIVSILTMAALTVWL